MKTVGQKRFMVVVVEYFSKWLEVEVVHNITARKMIDYIWGISFVDSEYLEPSFQTMEKV